MAGSKPTTECEGDSLLSMRMILVSFGLLDPDSSNEYPGDDSLADKVFALLQSSSTSLADFVSRIFPHQVPIDESFFCRLDELRRCIGIGESGRKAIGLVWSGAMQRLSATEQQQLLRHFSTRGGFDLFETLESVEVVIRAHPLSATFLAAWFADILKAVENDFVQNGLWTAIRAVCSDRAEVALEIINELADPIDQRKHNIASVMLGLLRGTMCNAPKFDKTDAFFRDHSNVSLRAVYNSSWITTARHFGISSEQLTDLQHRASISADDESNIVGIICMLVTSRKLASDDARECQQWIDQRISPTLSPDAKYQVIATVDSFLHDDILSAPTDWILRIGSVPVEHKGTWVQIEKCLCLLLKKDAIRFGSFFYQLCSLSAPALQALIGDRQLQRLTYDLARTEVSEIVGRLCLSKDSATRRLGLHFVDSLDIAEFPESVLQPNAEHKSRLLFFEMQRTMLKPVSIARILRVVAPVADASTDGFRSVVLEELKLQCHNYSGACRGELEKNAASDSLIAEAINATAEYFAALEQAQSAGISAMETPGHLRAIQAHRRFFSREVSKGAKEHSILLRMTKHTAIPYGRVSSQFLFNQLSVPQGFVTASHSMEMPVVEICDPEGMALRRLHASANINALTHPDVGIQGEDADD